MSLDFDEKNHIYKLDGKEIPSVSEITRFISGELYKDSDKTAMDIAADRGTRVHKATEKLDTEGVVECDDDISGYVRAYVKFRKEHKVEWYDIEKPVYDEGIWIAGTLDRYGYLDNEKTILDIKTTKRISAKHKIQYGAQLGFYQTMLNEKCKLLILQLREDGTYKLIPVEDDMAVMTSCLVLHKAFEMTKQKSKRRLKDG